MAGTGKSLFVPVASLEKLDPRFSQIRDWPGAAPARSMADDVSRTFQDPDGNFVEQFQTSGLDARYFELYLYAYFSRSGFNVLRDTDREIRAYSRQTLSDFLR